MGIPQCLQFDRGQLPARLDQFLVQSLPSLSRAQLKKLIDDQQVLVDGKQAKAGLKLKGGEVVSVVLPEPEPVETPPQDIPLHILYEDTDLIVIDKPAGLVVHPAPGHAGGTLVNALLFHCRDLSGIGGELRPGIVHRLDKDTSGVMVATKNDLSHQGLAAQFKQHTINRRYVALVHGLLKTDSGSIDSPIGRHPTQRKKMSGLSRRGRRAVTRWRVLGRFAEDRLSLVELALETGRTHQIRVHFSELNHPLVGDPLYGSKQRLATCNDAGLSQLLQQLGRQALHARLLGFTHPVSGEYLEFSSPLPQDLQTIIDVLQHKYRLEQLIPN
jgi:23S rRNA pseudouridine1911/1915/1917 synthase